MNQICFHCRGMAIHAGERLALDSARFRYLSDYTTTDSADDVALVYLKIEQRKQNCKTVQIDYAAVCRYT